MPWRTDRAMAESALRADARRATRGPHPNLGIVGAVRAHACISRYQIGICVASASTRRPAILDGARLLRGSRQLDGACRPAIAWRRPLAAPQSRQLVNGAALVAARRVHSTPRHQSLQGRFQMWWARRRRSALCGG